MKLLARTAAALAAMAVLLTACNKDKDSGSIRFDRPALYLTAGHTASVGFALADVDSRTLSVTSKPAGWDNIEVNAAEKTLTVTAPAAVEDDTAASGSVVLSGTGNGGIVSATLFVGIAARKDLSACPANSYLANEKETEYVFDALHKGDGRTELATARLEIIWQTESGLVQYLHFDGGKGSFYIGADADDETRIKDGNALIGAYDARDNLLWSWHVWAADFDPEQHPLVLDGCTLMDRNLGARANGHETADEILASYGLYYQWGRKDPFIGPSSYNAASGGSSAAMYDGSGTSVSLKMTASDAATGTMDYATQHPLEFITAPDKDADWLQDGTAARWSAAEKSVDDPCPYGWRVAPATAFAGLTIQDDVTAEGTDYASQYGWNLGSGTAVSFFAGAGRRNWRDGAVVNIYDESLPARALEMQPWVGYYWTSDAEDALSSAFCFWYKADDARLGGIRNNRPMGRANGMQVRCVRDE
ncbi:MAG: hypothetical protein K2L04_04440 [Alistipes sp.]|nr:hypothetical protein [Alistipes sp.]